MKTGVIDTGGGLRGNLRDKKSNNGEGYLWKRRISGHYA